MNPQTSLTERWWWLGASLSIAAFAIILRKILEKTSRQAENAPPIWVNQFLGLVYATGIPALALFWRGALTERGLGLQAPPWSERTFSSLSQSNWENWSIDIGWTIAITAITLALLKISDHNVAKYRPTEVTALQHNLGNAFLEALYHQIHWAFYREPFVLLWNINIGAWAALLPIGLETAINPYCWETLYSKTRSRNLVVRGVLVVVSTLIFIQTQNLWLAIGADMLIGWLAGYTPAEK